MAKKRKKPKKSKPVAKKKSEFGGGLSDQLKQIKLAKTPDATPAPKPTQIEYGKTAAPAKPLTDEEVFAMAVEGMDRGDVYKGKYGESNDDWRPDFYKRPSVESVDAAMPELSDEQAREEVETIRDMKMLELSLGGMDSLMGNSKFRVPTPSVIVRKAKTPFSTPLLSQDEEELASVTLDGTQRELLKRFASYERVARAPEVNVRGDTLETALERIELVVATCIRRQDKFLRVIHGKGKQSANEPVLKLGVLQWLEGAGHTQVSGYAPVVDRDGGFGALILEFRSNS